MVERILARGRAAPATASGEADVFLRAYFAHVDNGDLAERSPEDLFAMAAEHQQLAAGWEPGSVSVRVVSPRVEVDGWESSHSILLTVTDDLPFLVDSVTMELSRLNIGIHLVVHPVLARSEEGNELSSPAEHKNDTTSASLIAIEIDRQSDPETLQEIEACIERVIADVRVAIADWPAMRQRMVEVADSVSIEPHSLGDDEVAEAEELLRWLVDDHFIFLGYREYLLTPDSLQVVPGSGLGILHADPEVPVRPLAEMSPQVAARAPERRLLNLTKAGTLSTVHRAAYLDYIGVKTFDDDGNVSGERRFMGLYTAEVYSQAARQIPRINRLIGQTVERAGYPVGGHDEKRLLKILEDYPRDELLQIEPDDLFDTAIAIAGLQERRRVRLFARPELFGRFVTCMVYMPRDRYNTETRTAIEKLLTESYGGSGSDWSTDISDSVLARLLIHVRVPGGDPDDADVAALEGEIEEILRDWGDDLHAELVSKLGEDVGIAIAQRYENAFSPNYRGSFSPRAAVADLEELEKLVEDGQVGLNVYRTPGQSSGGFNLKLYRRGERISLTSIMPTLTNLGVVVIDEQPYEIRRDDHAPLWIYDFLLEHDGTVADFSSVATLVEQTFTSVWQGAVGDDGFNRLVLAAGLGPRHVEVLRVYARYLHQAGVAYSQTYIEQTLGKHAEASRILVELFLARFDPDIEDRWDRCDLLSASFFEVVDQIDSLDQDRILRRVHNLVVSTLRTNFFQQDASGAVAPYLAVKLDPTSIEDLPEPRPMFEIFVHSPRFEGVHLRAGRVARGGLRWSDRNEDFRTEVLGLVKAQMVKNAVIVPSGAKGGFVLKRPPSDGDQQALRDEVVACYRLFVSALLDLTDNLVDGAAAPPQRTVRHDDDDTYLVVAADKGTATFSDIANELAVERGYWLGDAFASGGSQGYDHKGMGITARGAWESVKRHFHELGRDIQTEPFTVVGVGDMSGDVFGNGMLLSTQIRLIAAFDHRHIFIDPNPDPAVSYAERQRLFDVPRSSWADYNTSLISPGGGVYPRSAKSIDLAPEAKAALGVDSDQLTPAELMTAVLRAPVDLMWNGGIGTYFKASTETNAEVGDKSNDAIRVDARDVRARAIGEGGNLGVTQRARVEFARNDGWVNTDAIDNAAGVDCSDHEVNIKIALNQVVADGRLTEKQRNDLLAEMTDDVAQLVLAHNKSQTQALSEERIEAASMVDVHGRYLASLAARDLLDRELEYLPDAETMSDRRLAGEGLTSPEIAVVLAYTKNILNEELLASTLPDDPTFEPLLVEYFPEVLQEQHADAILAHRLRREIVANRIANLITDRAGTTMVYRLSQETSAGSHEVAAAHMAAWHIFQLTELSAAVNSVDPPLPATTQLGIHLSARQLAERATRQLLRMRPYPFDAGLAIDELAMPVQEVVGHLPEYLVGADAAAYEQQLDELLRTGMPQTLAERVAAMIMSIAALDVVEVAAERGVDPAVVAGVHFEMADRLDLVWLRECILRLPRDSQWSSLARLTLRGDLYIDHRSLTAQAVGTAVDSSAPDLVTGWLDANRSAADHYLRTIAEIRAAGPADVTTLLVAAREVRNLISRTS